MNSIFDSPDLEVQLEVNKALLGEILSNMRIPVDLLEAFNEMENKIKPSSNWAVLAARGETLCK